MKSKYLSDKALIPNEIEEEERSLELHKRTFGSQI